MGDPVEVGVDVIGFRDPDEDVPRAPSTVSLTSPRMPSESTQSPPVSASNKSMLSDVIAYESVSKQP